MSSTIDQPNETLYHCRVKVDNSSEDQNMQNKKRQGGNHRKKSFGSSKGDKTARSSEVLSGKNEANLENKMSNTIKAAQASAPGLHSPITSTGKRKKRKNRKGKQTIKSDQSLKDSISDVVPLSKSSNPIMLQTQNLEETKVALDESLLEADFDFAPPKNDQGQQGSYMSPRKQSLKRYQQNDKAVNDEYITEIKENIRNLKLRGLINHSDKHDLTFTIDKSNIRSDDRFVLFRFKSANIMVFQDQLSKSNHISVGSGTLLAHGDFEIFQLQNGNITYLSCGPSFVYPLLPKLKLLRTSFNQFVLPLSNPERYWKIVINTESDEVMESIATILQALVTYTNLYLVQGDLSSKEEVQLSQKPSKTNDIPLSRPTSYDFEKYFTGFEFQDKHGTQGHNSGNIYPYKSNKIHQSSIPKERLAESSCSSIHNSPERCSSIVTGDFRGASKYGTSLFDWRLHKEVSNNRESPWHETCDIDNTVHTNTTKLVLEENMENSRSEYFPSQSANIMSGNLFKQSNPYIKQIELKSYVKEDKSDGSLDSLIDEYEENISVNKSFIPRSLSSYVGKAYSIASSNSQLHSNRLACSRPNDRRNAGSVKHTMDKIINEQYRLPPRGISRVSYSRSRRSSRSDLYSPETNWMDPNTIETTVSTQSRRAAALSTPNRHDKRGPQNSDLSRIYASISHRNLTNYLANDGETSTVYSSRSQRPITAKTSINDISRHNPKSTRSYLRDSVKNTYGKKFSEPPSSLHSAQSSVSFQKLNSYEPSRKLDSQEIYKIVSENIHKEANVKDLERSKSGNKNQKSLASRIFRW